MQVTAEAEREYWLSRQKAAVKAPAEIDVHAFHDAGPDVPAQLVNE
jgi:hypothetical protein